MERTTAPTVLDGAQALHWLHAAAEPTLPPSGLALCVRRQLPLLPLAAPEPGSSQPGGGCAGNSRRTWRRSPLVGLCGPPPTFPKFSWRPTSTYWSWRSCRPWWKVRPRKDIKKSLGPLPTGNVSVSITATMGMEDGHRHSGEAAQGGKDAGLHAALPLQHALHPVFPVPAKIFLVGL